MKTWLNSKEFYKIIGHYIKKMQNLKKIFPSIILYQNFKQTLKITESYRLKHHILSTTFY